MYFNMGLVVIRIRQSVYEIIGSLNGDTISIYNTFPINDKKIVFGNSTLQQYTKA